MTTEQQTIFDTILHVLNEAATADPGAINTLIRHYTECNKTLAIHPTIQVRALELSGRSIVTESDLNRYEVGPLGLINGLVEALTGQRVAATWDEADSFIGFTPYQETS